MIDLFGHPVLYYILRWLKEYKFSQVVLSCAYKHEIISNHFGEGSDLGLNLTYSIEETPLGRGGGIKLASQQLENKEGLVLVINGDIVTNLSISDLLSSHAASEAKVTIVTVPLNSPYGIVEINEKDLAIEFREKPVLPYWVNAGIYMIDASTFPLFPDHGDHEETLFPTLAKQEKLHAYRFLGFWRTIDTIKDFEEIKQDRAAIVSALE
jgi:NDP-sugar pyrophosphorylase family protein